MYHTFAHIIRLCVACGLSTSFETFYTCENLLNKLRALDYLFGDAGAFLFLAGRMRRGNLHQYSVKKTLPLYMETTEKPYAERGAEGEQFSVLSSGKRSLFQPWRQSNIQREGEGHRRVYGCDEKRYRDL